MAVTSAMTLSYLCSRWYFSLIGFFQSYPNYFLSSKKNLKVLYLYGPSLCFPELEVNLCLVPLLSFSKVWRWEKLALSLSSWTESLRSCNFWNTLSSPFFLLGLTKLFKGCFSKAIFCAISSCFLNRTSHSLHQLWCS